jgi:hypothetical protein
MQLRSSFLTRMRKALLTLTSFAMACLSGMPAHAQDEERDKAMEIFGFIMTDAGYNFNQMDPNWFDVMRPTKLPAFEDQYGADGNTYFSVRQTRLGVKNYFHTCLGLVKTHFEFDMFGVGVDAGQTTIRLRHAYAEVGKFGVGQTVSPFMDIDVFPNIVDYWGPNGMAFFRNPQIRYMPIQGDQRLTFALERPGGSADQGPYADRIQLQNVHPRFPAPDISAEYRYGGKWGYVEVAGILRRIEWRDQNPDTISLSGGVWGWGGSFSTNINFGHHKKVIFRGQVLYGEGIENYMNDAPVDIAVEKNFNNTVSPIKGIGLPVLGIVTFFDINWSKKWTSSIGYSMVQITNSNGQADNAFRTGQYGVANLLYNPHSQIFMGVEGQWQNRKNFDDGWNVNDWKIQFSFKFNFSHTFYRNSTPE